MATNGSNEILQDHNNKDLIKVLPAIAFLGLIMLVGLIGNILVLYIYKVKFKPSTIRYFIIVLAVIDLSICLFDIPAVFIDLRLQYTFGRYVILCKVIQTAQDFLFIGAAFLLLAVAAERYRKVCQPFKKQMPIMTGKITCVVSCTLAAISSLPAFVINGSSSVQLENSSVNGTRCSIVDDSSPVVLHISYVFLICLYLCSTFILIILYGLIWYKVLRHLKTLKRRETLKFTKTEQYTVKSIQPNTMDASETDLNELDLSGTVGMNSFHIRADIADQQDVTDDQPSVMISAVRRFSAGKLGKTRARDLDVARMTRTIFWVTLVTILTFFPIICGMAIELYNKDTFIRFKESLSSFHEIFMRSHYIQCAANPLLYSWFNTRFQYELKILFKR